MRQAVFRAQLELEIEASAARKRGEPEPVKRMIEFLRNIVRDPNSDESDTARATRMLAMHLCNLIEMEPAVRVGPVVQEYLDIAESVHQRYLEATQDQDMRTRLLALRRTAEVAGEAMRLSEATRQAHPKLITLYKLHRELRKKERQLIDEWRRTSIPKH